MASESERIRQLMDLLEGTTKPQILNEGWLSNLKDKKIKKLGAKERAQMADRLKSEWLKWLGQTGREGTMDDMERFMGKRIGFSPEDINHVLDIVYPGEEPEAAAPEADKATAPDPEDGIPLPKDLNRKLSDFGEVGIKVEPNDNKVDAGEIVDDPRKYRGANGDWDRKKISNKLAKMPIGDKLTLGSSTFSRSVGDKAEAPKSKVAAESIMEAEESDVLDRATVEDIMDVSAGYINDHYLLDGPRNDQADAMADVASNSKLQAAGKGTTRQSTPNTGGAKGSGQYDADEMWSILSTDFQKTKPWLASLTRKVQNAKSIGDMTDSDMQDLGLIAYAFLRART